MKYEEIKGDLISLAKSGAFDVIAHGCNCFCTQKAGIAKLMKEAFHTDLMEGELDFQIGNINKLGTIDYRQSLVNMRTFKVVNAYTQFEPGPHLDYNALSLCLKKINHAFKGKHIGLPQIGCGIAGGDWDRVQKLIRTHLRDVDVTVIIYKK